MVTQKPDRGALQIMASSDHVPLTKAAAEMYGPYKSIVKLHDIIGNQTGEAERHVSHI